MTTAVVPVKKRRKKQLEATGVVKRMQNCNICAYPVKDDDKILCDQCEAASAHHGVWDPEKQRFVGGGKGVATATQILQMGEPKKAQKMSYSVGTPKPGPLTQESIDQLMKAMQQQVTMPSIAPYIDPNQIDPGFLGSRVWEPTPTSHKPPPKPPLGDLLVEAAWACSRSDALVKLEIEPEGIIIVGQEADHMALFRVDWTVIAANSNAILAGIKHVEKELEGKS